MDFVILKSNTKGEHKGRLQKQVRMQNIIKSKIPPSAIGCTGICSCSVNIADEGIKTGSLSVSFSFARYYGGVIKQYRFLQVFIGNMMVLQIFCMKIKHDIFPLYKPLIFCVKIN